VEQQRSHGAAHCDRPCDAHCHADHTWYRLLTHDHAEDRRTLRAEGHAHTDFMYSLLDVEPDDAVDADDGEEYGDGGEQDEERAPESRLCHGIQHERSPLL